MPLSEVLSFHVFEILPKGAPYTVPHIPLQLIVAQVRFSLLKDLK